MTTTQHHFKETLLDVSCLLQMPLIGWKVEGTHSTRQTALPQVHIAKIPKPKRNLTAYNIFFRDERQRLLSVLPVRDEGKPKYSHGKVSFQELARIVAQRWRRLSGNEREFYDGLAVQDKLRHSIEMKFYKAQVKLQQDQEREQRAALRLHHELVRSFAPNPKLLELPSCLDTIFDDDDIIEEKLTPTTSSTTVVETTVSSPRLNTHCTLSYPRLQTSPTITTSIRCVSDAESIETSNSISSPTSATETPPSLGKDSITKVFGRQPLTLLGDIPDDAPWPV